MKFTFESGLFLLIGLLLGGSLLVSLLLTPLCARLAAALGMVDKPGARKIHSKVMPYGGGLAIWLTLSVVMLGCYAFVAFGGLPALGGWLDSVPGLQTAVKLYRENWLGLADPGVLWKLAGILGGATLIFVLGLIDDCRPLPAKLKLMAQIVAAVIVWAAGVRITLFIDSAAVSLLLTVGWVVIITNAFNLLDNMDGLSSGVALLAGLHLLLIAAFTGHLFIAAFLAVLCGAAGGFLRYNFSPARLFMGDAGALLLGFLLAVSAAAGTFYDNLGPAHMVLIPVLALGVPLFDTLSVIVIRLRRGASIFVGDTNHLSHRLVRQGFSRRGAVLLIYLLGFIFGQCALLLRYLDSAGAAAVFVIALAVTLLMAILMTARPQANG